MAKQDINVLAAEANHGDWTLKQLINTLEKRKALKVLAEPRFPR